MSNLSDWIDVTAKYGLSKDNPDVKTASAMYDKALAALGKTCDDMAKKAAAEKDAKKKKQMEESAMKVHQQGVIKIRKETEDVLKKLQAKNKK